MLSSHAVHPWKQSTLIMLSLLLGFLVLYRDTVLHVFSVWNQWADGEYYAHGYLVLLISLYMVWRERSALVREVPCPFLPALFPVIVFSLIWLLASKAGILLVQTAVLLPLWLSVIWAVLGGRAVRLLVMPVTILLFALPVWSLLPPYLQTLTADAAYVLTRLSGIPILQEGQVLVLPVGQFSVEESCSGLSYLLAAMTLGMFYAQLNHVSVLARLGVMLAAGIAAILANILRVFLVVYIGYRTNMQHPVVFDHFNLGWYLFGALALLLLVIDAMLMRRHGRSGSVGPVGDGDGRMNDCATSKLPVIALLCLVMLAVGPAWGWLHERFQPVLTVSEVPLPSGQGAWVGPLPDNDSWQPVYHGASIRRGLYQSAGSRIHVFAGLYTRQRQGSELIYDLNQITDGGAWQAGPLPHRIITAGDHEAIERELFSADGQRRLVWYWYRVAGKNTTSRYAAKALQVLDLVNDRQQAAVIALAVHHDNDRDAARAILADFTRDMDIPLTRFADGQPTDRK
jgi:exosortase A